MQLHKNPSLTLKRLTNNFVYLFPLIGLVMFDIDDLIDITNPNSRK